MLAHEAVVHACLEAITRGDEASLRRLLAEHAVFHFPGQSRFAGDYSGDGTIAAFWMAHRTELAGDPVQMQLEDVRVVGEQVIALVALRAQRHDAVMEWHGTFLMFIAQAQIAEWWCELGDRRAFDHFWTYQPAVMTSDAD